MFLTRLVPTIRWALVARPLGMLALCFIASSCTADSHEPSALQQSLDPVRFNAITEDYSERMTKCMKMRGFDYLSPIPKRQVLPAVISSLDDLREGYGVEISSITAGEQVPADQMGAYLDALGDPSNEGSCRHLNQVEQNQSNAFFEALKKLEKLEAGDKIIRSIDAEWSACMRRSEFEVGSPWDLSKVLTDKALASVGNEASIRGFNQWQMQLAAIDVSCRKDSFQDRLVRQQSLKQDL
jgi:hypothetical protein